MRRHRISSVSGIVRTAAVFAGRTGALAAVGYLGYAGAAWLRYGHAVAGIADGTEDPLLDAFMPAYEVVERHHIRVNAPAAVTLAAAREQELTRAPLVRSVFKARELLMGATPSDSPLPAGLLAQTLSIGWVVLAEVPDREVVVGAVTRPWEANVVFRGLPPQDFAAFDEPGYVKIIWSLRADPVDAGHSIFRTETRVVATDASARARFRMYWSFASPGIWLIRRLMLTPLKSSAERIHALRTSASASLTGDSCSNVARH